MADHELKQVKKKCNDCGKYFSRKNIRRHIKIMHTTSIKPLSKTFECHLCGKVLCSKPSMEGLRVKVKCEKCDKSFVSESNLKIHLKTHNNVREKAVCQFCNNTFLDEGVMKQHVRIYHKER